MSSDATGAIDYAALSEKYAEERAKRLRPDAADQWIEIRTEASHFDKDYHADPDFSRDPIVEEVDAVVVGAGVAGLLAAARIRESGVEKLRIVEKGGGFGGTWYWNRYPGLHCDVESYIYMPMIEELGVMPTEKYAGGREIREHCERVAEHYDLYPAALFQTAVTQARWDEERQRWIVSTSRGDAIATRFLVVCTGLLSNPKLPNLPGIDSFAGHTFHTSRWDFGYTGGDEDGNMTGLADKRVGLVGTGATAVQLAPFLQESAKHLYIFQRTPSAVDVRGNGPTDPEWARTLTPGWTLQRRENFTSFLAGGKVDEVMVDDGWTDILPRVADGGAPDPMAFAKAAMVKMERIRARVDTLVEDESTAEALKPWYHFGCKRPTFHDAYLQTFNEPNVTLVDSKGKGIERVTPAGVVVEGTEYPLDCLLFATGFDFNVEFTKENGADFIGRGGLALSQHWADGPRTLYGMQAHGFPNFLFIRHVQAGAAANFTHLADEQARHIAFIISQALAGGIASVEPSRDAEEAWVDTIVSQAGPRIAYLESCTPGYYNHEGKVDTSLVRHEPYAGGPMAYFAMLDDWRAEGSMRGLDLSPAGNPAPKPA